MNQKIDAVRTTAGSAAEFEHQLPAICAELRQQRRFRLEQLEQLAVETAETMATADQARLQVSRALTLAAESALEDINTAVQRLEQGSYGICEHCAKPIPLAAAGRAADEQTLHPLSVPRRVGPVPAILEWPDPIRQRNPVTGG
jgi:RNA polymerase-binding transcription factor DksA